MHATVVVVEAIVPDLDGTLAVPPEGRYPLTPVEAGVVHLRKAKKNGYLIVPITGAAYETRVVPFQNQTNNVADIIYSSFGAVKTDYRSGTPVTTLRGSPEEQAAYDETVPALEQIREMFGEDLCGKLGAHTVHYHKGFDIALRFTKEAIVGKEHLLRIYCNPEDYGIVVTYFSATKDNVVAELESEGILIVVGAGDGESDKAILLAAIFAIVTCTDEETHANPELKATGEEKGEGKYYIATPELPHGHGFAVGMDVAIAVGIVRSAPKPTPVNSFLN